MTVDFMLSKVIFWLYIMLTFSESIQKIKKNVFIIFTVFMWIQDYS